VNNNILKNFLPALSREGSGKGLFYSARLKLTAWYLLIIMFISLSFSFVIYGFVSSEINRFAAAQRFRLERRFAPTIIEENLINEIHNRLLLSLGIVNVSILLISGTLGYFLAGRTLKPIQTMVDEQNRFISDASHELKTPLTAMKTASEVNLRNKKLTLVDAKKLLSANLEDINRLQSLSENLLTLTRYHDTSTPLVFSTISLKDIVIKSIQKISPVASAKDIALEDLTSDIKFSGNFHSLVDLLIILVDNAVKYSYPKTVVSINSTLKNNSLQISVTDHGPGIDPTDLPHIFDRFYRADSARTKGGYGLGLSIAKKIVEAHQGTITVDSTPKIGSTFIISFPYENKA